MFAAEFLLCQSMTLVLYASTKSSSGDILLLSLILLMLPPPDIVSKGTVFSGCSSSAFVGTDIVTIISHERLEQSQ